MVFIVSWYRSNSVRYAHYFRISLPGQEHLLKNWNNYNPNLTWGAKLTFDAIIFFFIYLHFILASRALFFLFYLMRVKLLGAFNGHANASPPGRERLNLLPGIWRDYADKFRSTCSSLQPCSRFL